MADLIDYRKYSRKNGGMKYILVIIDAFSRFAYTAPLKFKTSAELWLRLPVRYRKSAKAR